MDTPKIGTQKKKYFGNFLPKSPTKHAANNGAKGMTVRIFNIVIVTLSID